TAIRSAVFAVRLLAAFWTIHHALPRHLNVAKLIHCLYLFSNAFRDYFYQIKTCDRIISGEQTYTGVNYLQALFQKLKFPSVEAVEVEKTVRAVLRYGIRFFFPFVYQNTDGLQMRDYNFNLLNVKQGYVATQKLDNGNAWNYFPGSLIAAKKRFGKL
ncbi:hypothetical protein, partial [Candidatus Methylobacter favarea]|uniref:hypothetical protein n=1 Tax=Candidatus Methylobacter favarea TaxID=2707345 RepID=UPI00157C29CC